MPPVKITALLRGRGEVVFTDTFAGTRGEARPVERFRISFNPYVRGLGMRYMAHVSNVGDTPYVRNGTNVGVAGRQIEGFAIELTGEKASQYTVQYMAHVSSVGDTSTCKDGEYCGTRGRGLAVEGFSVKVSKRTAPVPPTPTPTPTPTPGPTPVEPTPVEPVPTSLTFRPAVIPLSDLEIVNSYRGQYEWIIQNDLKPGWWPWLDSYDRLGWWQIEPTRGNYDFTDIDRRLALAGQRKGRHSLGIMTALSYDYRAMIWSRGQMVPAYNYGVQVPQYIRDSAGGWYRGNSWFPDWNNEIYLSRWEALLQALGDRYRDDPRFGYIDIRGYGDFGEWHLAGLEASVGGIAHHNAIRLVNATVNPFKGPDGKLKKYCLMLVAHDAALRHAVALDPKVGVRADGFGSPLGPAVGYAEPDTHPARQKWTTAPFVVEWFGNADNLDQQYRDGLDHVYRYHLAAVSGGNIIAEPGVSNYWAYEELLKRSGYRYEIHEVALSELRSGQTATLKTKWVNIGVTPAYDDWNVTFQLRNLSTGTVAYTAKSSTNLRSLLPTTGTTITDSFTLPTIPAGTYDLVVQVQDAGNYLNPMNLAIQGRQADGSYKLGAVRVS